MKKTIVVVSRVSIFDKTSHSGVVCSIASQLSKCFSLVHVKPHLSFVGVFLNVFGVLLAYTYKFLGKSVSHSIALSKAYAYDINKQLSKLHYDAIWGFDSVFLAYIVSSKPIYYRTDAVFDSMVDYYIFNIPNKYQRQGHLLETRVLLKSNYVFVPSQWVVNEIAKWFYEVDLSKIKFVHSGANMPLKTSFTPPQFSSESLRFLFIGKNIMRKGFDIAYEVVKIINEKYNVNAVLNVIGGDVGCYSESKYVRYYGFLDKNNSKHLELFEKVLSDSQWFLFPTHAECAGIVNCEVSAYGIPIVAFDTGGVSSYVLNQINGFCLPLDTSPELIAEKIFSVSKEEYLEFSSNARQLYLSKFNWDAWFDSVKHYLINP